MVYNSYFKLMYFREIKIIATTIFILCFFDAMSGEKGNALPEMVSEIEVHYGDPDPINNFTTASFEAITNDMFNSCDTLWLRLTIDNRLAKDTEYFIHFNNALKGVRLFEPEGNGRYTERVSGASVPEKNRSVGLIIKDKVPFHITSSEETVVYLRLERKPNKPLYLRNLKIVSIEGFIRYSSNTFLIQAFFVGIVFILCFFNLILFFLNHDKLHLYYFLYAFVTSVYFLFYFGILETFVFSNLPKTNTYFFFSVLVGQALYCLFLMHALKNEKIGHWRRILKSVTILNIAAAFLAPFLSSLDYDTGVNISDVCSMLNAIIITLMIFALYKKVSKTVKIIFIGTFFLILGGSTSLFSNIRYTQDLHVYFYQFGFVVELLFFAIAINYMHHLEKMEKVESYMLNLKLESESLKKEKEAIKLRGEIELKNRELASKMFIISEKEELFKDIIAQLKKVSGVDGQADGLRAIISNMKASQYRSNWQEFEVYFSNVHPRFYEELAKKYPDLSKNERRLCAFLKLNLSTKEISVVTGKSQNSIDVARSRMRRKMGLKQGENLASAIAGIV